ncbi:MAG: cyclic nucleotide-binding domain-containing protein, partial [Polyangiaceae bacterium]|nr:cyclic nucleotide-binding domain-containing protein [Polyangiaceae bacterium]
IPSALVVTSRLLERMGHTETATHGLDLAVRRAIDAGNLPLAVAAMRDLRALGVDVGRHLDDLAASFCLGSPRLQETETPPPPLRDFDDFQPLSSCLSGPALVLKATQVLRAAAREYEEAADSELPLVAPLPLFSALPKESLRELLAAFETITVPAGARVVREGEEGAEAYIVARGELEVARDDVDGGVRVVLARLVSGALFGEMALISRAPRGADVIATRPSILLVAKRDALEAVADKQPAVAVELAAHTRWRMVANLARTSRVLISVPPQERTALVERFETRFYEKGDKLVVEGQEAQGLHLVASGEVAVVAHEPKKQGEAVVIATLTPGETVGEVALVLRRKANADVIAAHPTVTLFLPREHFLALVHDHPTILHGLYMTAVRRDDETTRALDSAPASVADDYVLL